MVAAAAAVFNKLGSVVKLKPPIFTLVEVRILIGNYAAVADDSSGSTALVIAPSSTGRGPGPVIRVQTGDAPSTIDTEFQQVLRDLELGEIESARAMVNQLWQKLKVVNGMRSRSKGGCEYAPLCVLDSVLLADNCRSLDSEIDLLREVAQQSGS